MCMRRSSRLERGLMGMDVFFPYDVYCFVTKGSGQFVDA